MPRPRLLRWPYPYRWALAICDDTDESTLDDVRTFYGACLSSGVRPTKTVWTHRAVRTSGSHSRSEPDPGSTLEDEAYLDYCRSLSARGVELALHGASAGDNLRGEVERALQRFEEVFGAPPRVYVHHARNRENLYWGPAQFRSAPLRWLAKAALRGDRFEGHEPGSPHFWGDLAYEKIQYVRLFRTRALDLLGPNPSLPYHRPDTPWVRFWFSANAQGISYFRRLTHRAMDRLAARDGAALVYCHARFLMTGPRSAPRLHPDVLAALSRLSQRQDVWCVGVGALLDRCLAAKNLTLDPCRHALVLSNRGPHPVDRVQIRVDRPLYPAGGGVLVPDASGVVTVPLVPASACLPLYHSAEEARLADPVGAPAWEDHRMAIEELSRLSWQLFAIHLPERLRAIWPGAGAAR